MSDYDVGYRKPPRASRFKPGVSGNLKGRPKRQSTTVPDLIRQTLDGPVPLMKGRRSQIGLSEFHLKKMIAMAVNGDVAAIDHVLAIYIQMLRRRGGHAAELIEVVGGLPDPVSRVAASEPRREFVLNADTAAV